MPKLTRRELAIRWLEGKGWRQVESRSTKYVVLSSARSKFHYYISRSGAVRRGRTIAESLSVTHIIDWSLLQAVCDD